MLEIIQLLNSAILVAEEIEKEYPSEYIVTPLLLLALKKIHELE